MAAKIPLTVRGIEKLRDELKRLKSVERPAVVKAIAEARAHGDISENAEYNAAKEQQSFLEGRIADIENKLASAQVAVRARLVNRLDDLLTQLTLAVFQLFAQLVGAALGQRNLAHGIARDFCSCGLDCRHPSRHGTARF